MLEPVQAEVLVIKNQLSANKVQYCNYLAIAKAADMTQDSV